MTSKAPTRYQALNQARSQRQKYFGQKNEGDRCSRLKLSTRLLTQTAQQQKCLERKKKGVSQNHAANHVLQVCWDVEDHHVLLRSSTHQAHVETRNRSSVVRWWLSAHVCLGRGKLQHAYHPLVRASALPPLTAGACMHAPLTLSAYPCAQACPRGEDPRAWERATGRTGRGALSQCITRGKL